MTNPPVPEDYFADHWNEIYFGDNSLKEKATQSIIGGLSSLGKIYILCGPTRTGKGTVFKNIVGYAAGKEDLNVIDYSSSRDEQLINSAPEVNNVIRLYANNEIKELPGIVNKAQGIIQAHPNSSVFIEVLKHEPLIPYITSFKQQEELALEEKLLQTCANSDKNITLLRTGNNIDNVQKTLWSLNDNVRVDYSSTGEALKEEFFADLKHIDLDNIISALEEGNRAKYDIAFQRVKERMGLER